LEQIAARNERHFDRTYFSKTAIFSTASYTTCKYLWRPRLHKPSVSTRLNTYVTYTARRTVKLCTITATYWEHWQQI
jgi:hypothetical protein